MAELGVSAIESFLRLYLLIFLTDKIGLSADLAGYAVGIGILWDAFADPLMGRISDRTKSRFGRRLPWMALGAPILSLMFVLLFTVQPITDPKSWYTFLVVTILNLIMNSAMTMVAIPHLALGNELGDSNSQSRTAIYAWRSGMTLLGLLIGILVPAISNAAGLKPPLLSRSLQL
jgi:glycoside/pentoside/hexuronide:cation symporter, GPH family